MAEKTFAQKWLNLDEWIQDLGNWGISRALMLWILFIGLLAVLGREIPHLGLFTFTWMVGTAPIWVPISVIFGAFQAWIWYAQSFYIAGRDPVLLEIKIPREIAKSPRAMEVALANLWVTSGEVTFIHRFWRGQMRTQFSFEIASFGGEVHFFVWTWKAYREFLEAALYAQYPEIEIYPVEDYASKFRFDPKKYTCFCTDWIYSSGKDVYPIKSYIDFELDKDPKEEFKIDPLAQVLEFMSSARPHEQVWAQIVFSACQERGILIRHDTQGEWIEKVEKEVEEIRGAAMALPGEDPDAMEETGRTRFPHPTDTQKYQMETLDRHLRKTLFEVVARGVYIADITQGPFRGPMYSGTRWLWKPFNDPAVLNQLRPKRHNNQFDYPWQDIADIRWNRVARRFLDAYKRRSAFFRPWTTPPLIMTSEALATIYHFPGSSIAAPGLERIPATKAEPPSNLPK